MTKKKITSIPPKTRNIGNPVVKSRKRNAPQNLKEPPHAKLKKLNNETTTVVKKFPEPPLVHLTMKKIIQKNEVNERYS